MRVSVVYADPAKPLLLNCKVEDGCSVEQAIEQSGLLRCCPDIDLKKQKVGVFGKFVKLDSPLKEGDRVEVYQRITRVLDDDDDDDDA
ncbi:RnfH family protein [Azotobacter beijerinckii]|uniref:RnfH family protein n=1 Tax=Azotobacter beijerinckii TaxID=170623 RepID=UPI0029533CA1|nr:RnfH family protein [Azotobacter beijerinckii]MDV7211791.1 RnfH family protein [Azotobacter beijerinckii]